MTARPATRAHVRRGAPPARRMPPGRAVHERRAAAWGHLSSTRTPARAAARIAGPRILFGCTVGPFCWPEEEPGAVRFNKVRLNKVRLNKSRCSEQSRAACHAACHAAQRRKSLDSRPRARQRSGRRRRGHAASTAAASLCQLLRAASLC